MERDMGEGGFLFLFSLENISAFFILKTRTKYTGGEEHQQLASSSPSCPSLSRFLLLKMCAAADAIHTPPPIPPLTFAHIKQ
jgi:hypothetical protein